MKLRALIQSMTIRGAALSVTTGMAGLANGQVALPAQLAHDECGTVVTAVDAEAVKANQQAGLYDGGGIAAADCWYIPLTVHVVRQSNGAGGLPESRVQAAMSDLNAEFAASGMVFYRSGPTRYINSNALYSGINTQAEIDTLKQTDVIAGTVNIYFTESLSNENGGLCGQSSFTTSDVQGIALSNDCSGLADNHSTVPHEVGHYFDLFHTHETAFGAECVNGSNCMSAGDLICDTPADPKLTDDTVNASCQYTGSERDACSNTAYHPQAWNLMSYSRKECRNAFTAQQSARARATLENLRIELEVVNCTCSSARFVNSAFPNGGSGSAFFPYDTFAEGPTGVATGGCVIVAGGNYPASNVTINKAMTIKSNLGVARIGS